VCQVHYFKNKIGLMPLTLRENSEFVFPCNRTQYAAPVWDSNLGLDTKVAFLLIPPFAGSQWPTAGAPLPSREYKELHMLAPAIRVR
jgi:hypothetical protein